MSKAERLLADEEIARARLLTSDEVKAIAEEAIKFAGEAPDSPESVEIYQVKQRELAGALSGRKVAKAQDTQTAKIVVAEERKRILREVEDYIARDLEWASEEDEMLWKNKLQLWRASPQKG